MIRLKFFHIISFLVLYLPLLLGFRQTWGLTPDNVSQNDREVLQKISTEFELKEQEFHQMSNDSKFNDIKGDPAKLIDKQFAITPFYEDSVYFWYTIHTFYNSDFVIIHDKNNLKIIYETLDFTELQKTPIHIIAKVGLQEQLSHARLREYKRALLSVAHNKPIGPQEKKVLSILKNLKVEIPKDPVKRKSFLIGLAINMRVQTGLNDDIRDGLVAYRPYQKTIENYFANFHLPKELLSMAFVESSFNVKAYSNVGAAGVWQFISQTAEHFIPVNKWADCRRNPLISTVAALHLLQQNFKNLKQWDLAITAYNSGTVHLFKAKRKMKDRHANLEKILEYYDHRYIG
ncbi:MAG: transglycosylase SLT domain-containing protein, partial [Pseudomonadota bacterium]